MHSRNEHRQRNSQGEHHRQRNSHGEHHPQRNSKDEHQQRHNIDEQYQQRHGDDLRNDNSADTREKTPGSTPSTQREKDRSDALCPGLYEQVISEKLAAILRQMSAARKETAAIDSEEAAMVLSRYLEELVQQELTEIADRGGGIEKQVTLTNRIIQLLHAEQEGAEGEAEAAPVAPEAELLQAVLAADDPRLAVGGTAADLPRPETSLAAGSLFTGAHREPKLYTEIKKEIASCSRIDMLVSFIRFSGLRLILDDLRGFAENGGRLRVITTSYMGATDAKAVRELAQLPNTEIHISYNTKNTRLHAKAYVFHRETGFTTAYVGSSNLSNAAMTEGLEWNVKVTEKEQPAVMQKICGTFESYWNSAEFERYHTDREEDAARLTAALQAEKAQGRDASRRIFFDVRPYPFQQQILDQLRAEREVRGAYRNLIVAATGTGKTMIAAFDYRDWRREHPERPGRLLFVAHREEILRQALYSFQEVLQDPNFGELYVGRRRPGQAGFLFASIQTINARELCEKLPDNYYDYIVVDEFHHAAAPTYRKLLQHFRPRILLGLTATPERMDGKSILDYFDQRCAAEIRLREAIDRGLLCPFQYFGVSDTVDLDGLHWSRGGYEKSELNNVYVFSREAAGRRVDCILRALERYVTDLDEVKGLGFCVSVEHAGFMAEQFNERGVPSLALSGASPEADRAAAKEKLTGGKVRFLFVVDLYNEGVDIPAVNTILFLRPTESLTVFLQQLGRGLRLDEGKECLTVLDFVGRANRRYDFEQKFAALLTGSERSVQREILRGFPSLPTGCYIQLEKKAQESILKNIRGALQSRKGLIARLATFAEDSGQAPTLAAFCRHYRLEPREIYRHGVSFSRLCCLAGVRGEFAEEPAEEEVNAALGRLAAIDSRRWISFLQRMLGGARIGQSAGGSSDQSANAGGANDRGGGTDDPGESPDGPVQAFTPTALRALTAEEQRMMEMFYITIWREYAASWDEAAVQENLRRLAASPVMTAEILALLQYRYEEIDFIDEPVDLGFDCPLDLHCTYTRDQLFAALDYEKPGNIREGVKWLPDLKTDVLLVTLNKSDRDYSPTTMYRDYSISDTLFHWQSQSTTSASSSTGQRYIHHRERGSRVLLFVREFRNDRTGAAPYTFLGPVDYLQHEGSRPMNITWKLRRPIPAKFLRRTNKLASV